MTRFVHVEITADRPDRVARFYAEVLGWATEESPFVPGYHLLDPGEGPGGAVASRAQVRQPTVAWVEVPDVDAVWDAVVAAGGSVVNEVQELPGVGRLCYVADPEGTWLGLKSPA